MSLDLQKNIVLVGIGGCVVLLLIVRAAEGPQTESETPPMPASEEGASPQSPSPGPGAGGGPSDAATERVRDGEQRNAEALEDTGPSAATDATMDELAVSDDDDVEPPPRTIWTPDREGIGAAVRESQLDLHVCYEEWLKLDPSIEKKITIQFVIETSDASDPDAPRAEDGTEMAVVEELGIASDMEHPFMEGCVSNVFSDFWFSPPPDGRLEVTYPLSFSRE